MKSFVNTTPEYFSQLYKKYSNKLYGFGIGMGLSRDTCLDVIHDVFCRIIEKDMVFETDSIKHYLFRSFINRYINIQKSRKNLIPVDVNDLPFVMEVYVEPATCEEDMIEKEEAEKTKQKIEFLLSLLTKQQHKAVYLRYMEEMEYEEIGKLLGMKVESVRMLVFRGIEKLRKHVGKLPVLFLLF